MGCNSSKHIETPSDDSKKKSSGKKAYIKPQVTGSFKRCNKCNERKNLSDFYDPKLTNSYGIVCMECKKATQRAKEKRKYYKRKGIKYSEPQSTRYEASAKERIEPTISGNVKDNQFANSKLNMAVKLGEKEIEITYKDKRGKITKRKVDIFEVTHTHLIGYCSKVNARRTFLRSGILELKRLEFE